MPKTLQQIYDDLNPKVGATITPVRLNVAYFDLPHVSEALLLVSKAADGLLYTSFSAVSWNDDALKTILTITGTAGIGGGTGTTSIVIDQSDANNKKTTITSTLNDITIRGLQTSGVITTDIGSSDLTDFSFSGVAVTATSSPCDLSIAKTAAAGDCVILPGTNVKVTGLKFTLRKQGADSASVNTTLSVTGQMRIGTADDNAAPIVNVTLTAPVSLDNLGGSWELSVDSPPGNAISLATVANLLGNANFFDGLPADLRPNNVTFDSLVVNFAVGLPNGISFVDASIAFSITGDWTLYAPNPPAPPFKFTGVKLMVELSEQLSIANAVFTVEADFDMSGVPVKAQAVIELDEDWTLSVTSSGAFDFTKLSALTGGDPVPAGLNVPFDAGCLSQVEIERAEIVFNPTAPIKFKQLDISVRSRGTCSLIPDWLEIRQPSISLSISDPLNAPTRRVEARVAGTLRFLTTAGDGDPIDVGFSLARTEGRWILDVQLAAPILVGRILSKQLPATGSALRTLLQPALDMKVASLSLRYATTGPGAQGEFMLSAVVTDVATFTLEATEFAITSASIEVRRTGGGPTNVAFRAASRLGDIDVVVGFQLGAVSSVFVEVLGIRGNYDIGEKVVTITFGNRTIGEMVQPIYRLVTGRAAYQFNEPWNYLESVSLSGLEIKLNMASIGQDAVFLQIDKTISPAIDLGVFSLTRVGLVYRRDRTLALAVGISGGAGVNFDLSSQNASQPPSPAPTMSMFKVKFLAVGQRLEVLSPGDVNKVVTVFERIRATFQAPGANQHPLTASAAGLRFNPDRQWIFGADLELLRMLSLKLLFNDGVIAGLALGLSGAGARFLAGLDFEILYKKVTESIGVYQIEVRVPDAIRQIELGQVSITIPVIALEIYTNGNFRVDLGFPKNGDFSRSFNLQVFPFFGSGGFYFGLLEGPTAPRLPSDYVPTRGSFNPVLSFGIGLKIGVGKSIDRGIFAAELTLGVEGILEGVLAFFKPADNIAAQVPNAIYYWLTGSLGIVGRIRGSVSFAVISAQVSLTLYARIGATIESFRPLIIFFEAGVNVNLTVRVGIGWLGTDINCSFETQISERFEIPVRTPGNPAWAGAAQHALPQGALVHDTGEGALPGAAAHALGRTDVNTMPDIPIMSWGPVDFRDDRPKLELLFRPQYTVAKQSGDTEQFVNIVAMLFLENVGPDTWPGLNKPPSTKRSFEEMACAMLLWSVNSLVNPGRVIREREEVRSKVVTLDQLRGIYRALTAKGGNRAPFTARQVTAFLHGYFDVFISPPERPNDGVDANAAYYTIPRPTVTVFPMIPELRLQVLQNGELQYDVVFERQTIAPPSYRDTIQGYFGQMGPRLRTDLEKMVDDMANVTDPDPADTTPRSVADYVFEDYFLLVARGVMERAIEFASTYQHPAVATDGLAAIGRPYGVTAAKVAAANANVPVNAQAQIVRGGAVAIAQAGDTLRSLTLRTSGQATDTFIRTVAKANAFVPNLLRVGAEVLFGDEGYYEAGTGNTLVEANSVANPGGDVGDLAVAIADTFGLLAPGARVLVPVSPRTHAVQANQTPRQIAAAYVAAGQTAAFITDLAALNAFDTVLVTGATLNLPGGGTHEIELDDTLASIASSPDVGSTPGALLNANLDSAAIITNPTQLFVPPTVVTLNAGDTLASVATALGVTVEQLATANADVGSIYPGNATLTLPQIASIEVGTLFDAMFAQGAFQNLAGAVSRFTIPGLQLPPPNGMIENPRMLWQIDPNNPLVTPLEPLYVVTGQQFEVPSYAVPQPGGGPPQVPNNLDITIDVRLVAPKGGDDGNPWYIMGNDADNDYVSVEHKLPEVRWFETLRGTDLVPNIKSMVQQPTFQSEARQLTLGKPIRMVCTSAVQFAVTNQNQAVGGPTIWSFSDALLRVISEPHINRPAFSVVVGDPEPYNRSLEYAPAAGFVWATAIDIKLRVVTTPIGVMPNTYELIGTDPEGVLRLEQILAAAVPPGGGQRSDAFIRAMYLLTSTAPVEDLAAVAAEDPAGLETWIARTNLSSLTNPTSSKGMAEAKDGPQPRNEFVTKKLQTLETLWKGSIVRSGGYYLYYQRLSDGAGLPEAAFDEEGNASITLLITYTVGATGLPPYLNRVVLGSPVGKNTAAAAESLKVDGTMVVLPGSSVAGLLEEYRTSIEDLALAVGGMPVRGNIQLTLRDWWHVVAADETWASIAALYSVDASALSTLNGGGLPQLETSLRIPTITHTTSAGQSLAEIATLRNVSLRELMTQNADASLFVGGVGQISEQMLLKRATVPAGHAAFRIVRQAPNPGLRGDPQVAGGALLLTEPTPGDQIGSLYSMLGYRIQGNAWYNRGIEGLPEGPARDCLDVLKPDNNNIVTKVRMWHFESIVPAYRFAKAAPAIDTGAFPASENPYRTVGSVVQVGFEWHDVFGNTTFSPFNKPALKNVPNNVPLRLGYCDEIIGIEQWPAVSASYTLVDQDGYEQIVVTLKFDYRRYQVGTRGVTDPENARRAALADLEAYRMIYYQLTWGDTEIWMNTTLQDGKPNLNRANLVDFVTSIITYLRNVPAAGAAPPNFVQGFAVSVDNPAAVFPLTVSVGITRHDVIDSGFRDMPSVRTVSHEVEPFAAAAGDGQSQQRGAIREFASTFEGLFSGVRLATGLSRAGDRDADSRTRLWVVRINTPAGYDCHVNAAQQYFFAPTPLSLQLLSKDDIAVKTYTDDGDLVDTTKSYSGIDLDAWARRFLAAIDTILLPQYAVPIVGLDHAANLDHDVAGYYHNILKAKEDIANAISLSVEGIAEGTGGDIDEARELMRQRMLVRLSSAYETDTIVQLGATIASPFTGAFDIAPKLYGQPVATPFTPTGSNGGVGADPAANVRKDFTLSSTKIPLSRGQSYMTFLFDSERAEPEATFPAKLTFTATALEHQISSIQGVDPDYKASAWLTFVNPLPVVIDVDDVRMTIPIPIRSYPIPPSLTSQSVKPRLTNSDDEQPLEWTRQYTYTYSYDRIKNGHDLVYLSPRFNVKLDASGKPVQPEPDLFESLAMFDHAWDKIQSDLLLMLPLYMVGCADPARVRKALDAFTLIVGKVAAAWGRWPCERYVYETEGENADEYLYVLVEKLRDGKWEAIVRKCRGPLDAPMPVVKIGTWQTVTVDPDRPGERRYQFRTGNQPDSPLCTAEPTITARTISFEEIDIVNRQNTWAGIQLSRNETLFGDKVCIAGAAPRTNRNFIYRTPMVRFADVLTPMLEYNGKINVAAIGAGGPGRSIQAHVAALFNAVFENVRPPKGTQELRLVQTSVRYEYRVNDPVPAGATALDVTLPIVMAPPFMLSVRADLDTPCGMPEQFVCGLSRMIREWYGRRLPSRAEGRFVFDISVYSSLGNTRKLPIYRASNLQLRLQDATDLVEPMPNP